MANFFFFFFFFFFLSCLVCSLAQNQMIRRDIAISCGSTGISISSNGKKWIGDITASSSIVIKGSSSSTSSFISTDPIPYDTARVSTTQFSYTIPVSPGNKLIRLHFSRPSNSYNDFFTVKAGPFTLLRNFSVSLTCHALALKSLVKEYYISVEQDDQTLNIIFDPQKIKHSGKTYALVNGIEVISMASDFYYSGDDDLGAPVVGEKSRLFIDSSTALEMIQRLSFRWDPIALIDEKTKDFHWKTSVDVGFGYLVRLHFFETSNTVFSLFINDMIAESNVANGIYRHRDYMVMVKGPKEEGKRDLSIALELKNDHLVSELYKGLEIFKLSNHENSLAGPNPSSPRQVSKSNSILLNILLIFGRGNAIVTAAVLVISLVNIVAYKLRQIWEANSMEEINKPLGLSGKHCRPFLLVEIQSATENFNDALVIGKGGFGNVYKGIISKGQQVVAVKRLKSNSNQGVSEFWMEVETLSKIQHNNLISLIGYCNECEEMILVYEYIAGGTLADKLFRPSDCISWKQRLSICIGVGRGLDYLQTGTDHEIIHRDIKASNILLDENLEAKISDFGLAKPRKRNRVQSFVSTNVKGTFGYFDPDYFRTRRLTRKSDTFAFGVVLFEVLCGRPALDKRVEEEKRSLTIWVQDCLCKGEINEVVAPSLRAQISAESLITFVEVAQRCLHDQPNKRPTMAQVVVQLECALEQQERAGMTGFDSLDTCTGETIRSTSDETPSVDEHEHSNNISPLESKSKSKMVLNVEPSSGIGVPMYRRKANPYKLPHFWPLDTLWKKARQIRRNNLSVSEYFGKEVELYRFDLTTIAAATENFSVKNMIEVRGFYTVYKGVLSTGQVVAVKRYKSSNRYFYEKAFRNEVLLASKLEHPNIIKLVGYCFHGEERILVHEFMENQGLDAHLFARPKSQPPLDWPIRKRIALGAARGLAYLHDHCDPKIIHGGVKAANILLDEDFEAVVGDFGLAKLMDYNDTHVTTAIVGTFGYVAPEYITGGKCSEKIDVFGYGVTLLELIASKRAPDLNDYSDDYSDDDDLMSLDWVKELLKQKKLETLVDADLQGNYIEEEVEQLIQVALLCTQNSPMERPKMSDVVRMLEGDDLAERWEERPMMSEGNTMFRPEFNKIYDPIANWIIADSYSYSRSDELIADYKFNILPDELSGPR